MSIVFYCWTLFAIVEVRWRSSLSICPCPLFRTTFVATECSWTQCCDLFSSFHLIILHGQTNIYKQRATQSIWLAILFHWREEKRPLDRNWNQNADRWNLTNSPTDSHKIAWMMCLLYTVANTHFQRKKFKETQFGSIDSIWPVLKTTPRKRNEFLFRNSNSITRIMATDVCAQCSHFVFDRCFLFLVGLLFEFRIFFRICVSSRLRKRKKKQQIIGACWVCHSVYFSVCVCWRKYWNGKTCSIGCYDAWNLIMTISPIELHWIINLGIQFGLRSTIHTKKILLLINKQKTCAYQIVCLFSEFSTKLSGVCSSVYVWAFFYLSTSFSLFLFLFVSCAAAYETLE